MIEKMREMLEVQGQEGNWNYDEYMHGMYNGMEYMLSVAENRAPVYREKPEMWLKDKCRDCPYDIVGENTSIVILACEVCGHTKEEPNY
jgi:hypothetical protein